MGKNEDAIAELRDTCRRIQGTSDAREDWAERSDVLRECILTQDPTRFLQWDCIRGVMFSGFFPEELAYFYQRPDWMSRWASRVMEIPVGNPPSANNLLHQAYHLARFEDATGFLVSDMDFILEFGGGYGCMCRLCFSLGFRGRYVLFDLPVIAALQRYYLTMATMPFSDIAITSDRAQLENLLEGDLGRSLFIATWSANECSQSVQEWILPLSSKLQLPLIAFSGKGNLDILEKWWGERTQVLPIKHVKDSYYLMGTKKETKGVSL